MTNYLDNETIRIAKEYKLDKKLISRCMETIDSFEKDDSIYHRNLQTQVYAVSNYTNKDTRKINNTIIHYGDRPEELLKDFPKLQEELKNKYGINQ